MDIPSVKGYGNFDVEPFEAYLSRWPRETYPYFPVCLIENWVYRHWQDFSAYWIAAGALEWSYKQLPFTNEEVATICTFKKMMETMKFWGDELFRDRLRQKSWLADYMLREGTTPVPILVFESGANFPHPFGNNGETMCTPYQLIEGHMRTSYLWGMHRESHVALKSKHQVWVASCNVP